MDCFFQTRIEVKEIFQRVWFFLFTYRGEVVFNACANGHVHIGITFTYDPLF